MTTKFLLSCVTVVLLGMALFGCGGGHGSSGQQTPVGPFTMVASADNRASVSVPSNAGIPASQLTATPSDPASLPASDGLIDGAAYDFGPTGTQFKAPVTVAITYIPAQLRAGIAESSLALFTVSNGDFVPVPGSTVDTNTKTVSAQVTHFSTYAILSTNSFAGTFKGHYTGTSSGSFTMVITESGKLTVNGTDPVAGAFSGTGTLTLAGSANVSATGSGGASNGGTFTFVGAFQKSGSTVTSTGNWSGSGGAGGTWGIP